MKDIKLCYVKQPYSYDLAWESLRYPSSHKLLEALPFRPRHLSLLIEFEADIWVEKGEGVGSVTWKANEPGGFAAMYAIHKNVVSMYDIPWEEYDVVISDDPLLSADIIRTYPNILWCYYELEHRCGRSSQAAGPRGSPYGAYDLYLDHYMRSTATLSQLPRSISFPFLYSGEIMRSLVNPVREPAVFVDSRHTPQGKDSYPGMSRELGTICGLPIKYTRTKEKLVGKATKYDLESLAAGRMVRAKEYLELLGGCKYFLEWRKRAILGQGVCEAVSLGLIAVGNEDGVYHKMLCHPKCLAPSRGIPKPGLKIIRAIEATPDLQEEILQHQERALRKKFWDRPLQTLYDALEMKRES